MYPIVAFMFYSKPHLGKHILPEFSPPTAKIVNKNKTKQTIWKKMAAY